MHSMQEWWTLGGSWDGVPFALDANGNLCEVDEVARGKACGCVCVDCRGALVARQGEVRVHHFAHDDRRECRRALDASLFKMAMQLLQEPGATLMLPTVAVGYDTLIEERIVPLDGAIFGGSDLSTSRAETPEAHLEEAKLRIHLLTGEKSFRVVESSEPKGEAGVLGINLRAYARRWWEPCNPDVEGTITAVGRAREQMRQWLALGAGGRGWIFHPSIESHQAELAAQAEGRRQEAEKQAAAQKLSVAQKFLRSVQNVPRHWSKGSNVPLPPTKVETVTAVVRKGVDQCPVCKSARDEIVFGSGELFAGKHALRCSHVPSHPLQFVTSPG
jgi:hypothetical protein